MKAVLAISISFFLVAACGSQPSKRDDSPEDRRARDLYHATTLRDCSMKYKENSEYCKCFADAMAEVAPVELQSQLIYGVTKVTYSGVRKVILENRAKLKSCDRLMKVDLSIPEHMNSRALQDILARYQGEILQPGDEKAFDYSDLTIGYQYSLQNITKNKDGSLDAPSTLRLTKIDRDDYYFSTIGDDGNIKTENIVVWKNGVMYFVADSGSIRPRGSDSKCKFVVGVCSYASVSDSKEEINTVYESGVWIRSVPGFGHSRRLMKEVYDKNGVLLYQLNKTSSAQWEKVRVES